MQRTIIRLLAVMLAASARADEKIRTDDEWLKHKHAELAAIKTVTNVPHVALWTSGNKQADGQYGYFPKGNGLIVFEDKTWVLLVSHSMHAKDGLGDLTIVRTSDGRFLLNRGHVCDKLILESPGRITSMETFLKATGKGAKGGSTQWEPCMGEHSPPATRATQPEPRMSGPHHD